MVIHQFNRLIKNKWVWGVFAIAISVFFAFDFLLVDRSDSVKEGSAGTLGGKDVTAAQFQSLVNDARGYGRARDNKTPASEINRQAWKTAAALSVAKSLSIEATDDDVRAAISRDPSFQEGGQFNNLKYQMLLRDNGMNPELFEQFLKRRLTLNKLQQVVLGSAAWVSPMELEGAINDVTDKFTVRVASFTDKDSDKVKLDDKGLETYYKDNTNSIALPDTVTVKFAKFMADTPARLAGFKIAAEEVSNQWDIVQDQPRFKVKKGSGTNTVTEVMSLAQAWPIVENELKVIASVDAYRTNLLFRVYPQDDQARTDNKVDRLEKIAAEDKVKVETSKPFALDGRGYVKGFMERANQIAPGCEGFAAAVAELDPESAELRYGVVVGTNCVYLVERASFRKAHVPTFAEAKEIIRADALADARKKAFKASVEKTRALAAAELAKGSAFDAKLFAGATVSTQIVFSVSSMQYNSFADAMYVSRNTMKLAKGKMSDFISTGDPKRALVVYVENREPGDAAQAQMVRAQLRDELGRGAVMTLPSAWQEWNLNRLGFKTTAASSVEASNAAADIED